MLSIHVQNVVADAAAVDAADEDPTTVYQISSEAQRNLHTPLFRSLDLFYSIYAAFVDIKNICTLCVPVCWNFLLLSLSFA